MCLSGLCIAGVFLAMKMRAVKRREAQVHMGEENVAKGQAKNVLKSKELDVRRGEER